ncbi:blue light receptor [Serendipita sp. 399]|nr:blue light receptor [Serendipita sp. 399]
MYTGHLGPSASSTSTVNYTPDTGHYPHPYVSTSMAGPASAFASHPYSTPTVGMTSYQSSSMARPDSALPSIPPTVSQKPPRSSSLALNGLPIYSSSGFDMLDILARVATRAQPKVTLGPVDMSCAFLVTDVTREDSPIIYVSSTFTDLTGYTEEEIIGKNCRFLQAPPGVALEKGGPREHTDIDSVTQMAQNVSLNRECQVTLVNYRKTGEAFINCVTIIPIIPPGNEPVRYHVGFQVDLAVQPLAIMRSVQNGNYITNYSSAPLAPVLYQTSKLNSKLISKDMVEIMNRIGVSSASTANDGQDRHKLSLTILGESPDSIFIVSLKGSFLYVTPSISKLLKYDADYFLNKNLSDICHPSDLAPVMRSIKESSTPVANVNLGTATSPNQPQAPTAIQDVELMFRARCSDGTYIWLESFGRLHSDTSRGRKALLLRLRKVEIPRVTWSMINASGGIGAMDCYIRVARDDRGLIVASLYGVEDVLGKKKEDIVGKTLSELVIDDASGTKREAIKNALRASDTAHLSADDQTAYKVVFCNMPAMFNKPDTRKRATPGVRRAVALATTELIFFPPLAMGVDSSGQHPESARSEWWKAAPDTIVVKLRVLHRRTMRMAAAEATHSSMQNSSEGFSSFGPGLSTSNPSASLQSSSGYGLSTNDVSQFTFYSSMSLPVQPPQQETRSSGAHEIARRQGFQVEAVGDINSIDDSVVLDDPSNAAGPGTQSADGPPATGGSSTVGYSWQYELQQLRMRNMKLKEEVASLRRDTADLRKDKAKSSTTRVIPAPLTTLMEQASTNWSMVHPATIAHSSQSTLPEPTLSKTIEVNDGRKRTWSQTGMQPDWNQWGI